MSIVELWRRLTLLHMNSMELHSQRQLMHSWSQWSRFKHSLFVSEDVQSKSAEGDTEGSANGS